MFIDFFVAVADGIYNFINSFSLQIVNGLGSQDLSIIAITPMTVFWFAFIINCFLIPFMFLLPSLHFGKSKENKKENKKDN